jgi:putative membrane-bound dehydrogenase-like protein
MRMVIAFTVMALTTLSWSLAQENKADVPRALDERLEVVCFAKNPDIVHPVGLAVDRRGRVLVIESHTHFRPDMYKGPATDRVRMFEDTNGDGKADRITTFFEGTKASMDLAIHPNGDVYLATRNEIWRLRDTKETGQADEKERIIFLDTKGDYPHNGLSGLAFDLDGELQFGLGENLGVSYQLKGSDGKVLTGEGEGGNIFWCTKEGKQLRKVATGFWNPFGIHVDSFGRVFAVDNDPDAMPPCRLLHIVEGGDYGYQYRYGRTRRQPFHAWNGELPGTLPMLAGTGEAPCEVLAYEGAGLPAEHYGKLLVTAWADHRIEQYDPQPKGATYTSERKLFLQGGKDFRPVGLAMAPDGSLFVSDWVLADYNLHGRGAIWQVRAKQRERGKVEAPLLSKDRLTRESAAKQMASTEQDRVELRRQLTNADSYVRSVCLRALHHHADKQLDLMGFAKQETFSPLKALAVRLLMQQGQDVRQFLGTNEAGIVRVEAIRALTNRGDAGALIAFALEEDSFVAHVARQQLARHDEVLDAIDVKSLTPQQRAMVLLAQRTSGRPGFVELLPKYLHDADEDVRFLAVKWVADEKLKGFRSQIEAGLGEAGLSVRMYQAYATALARLDNQTVTDAALAERFIERLRDPNVAPGVKVQMLRLIPADHPKLSLKLLTSLTASADFTLRREAVWTLNLSPHRERFSVLRDVTVDKAKNEPEDDVKTASDKRPIRADALVGIAEDNQRWKQSLWWYAFDTTHKLREEALRSLIGVSLYPEEKQKLEKLADEEASLTQLVQRVLGQPFKSQRPATEDVNGWLSTFGTGGNIDAGRRVFFHSKLAGCYRCHMVDGRGSPYGPDLSMLGRTEPRRMVESLLQPSATVAPSYQAWTLVLHDGRVLTGMVVHTNYDEYTYLDAEGKTFKVKSGDIAETKASAKSIMPENLMDQLTDQEVRDLLAYLLSRR